MPKLNASGPFVHAVVQNTTHSSYSRLGYVCIYVLVQVDEFAYFIKSFIRSSWVPVIELTVSGQLNWMT